MREQLWRYFPAMLDLESDLGAEWLLDLWEIAPTPHKAIRVREATVAKVLKRNRIRRFDAAHVLDVLRKPPVQVAAGTTEAAAAHIKTLTARIRLVNHQLGEAHRQLDALTARLIPSEENGPGQRKQHDVEILASLPGVGRIVLATLLAEAFDALQRRDYAALRSLTGVAPVTKRSGKSCIVVRRQACHDRLANAMYHWARVAVQRDPRSRSKYATLRSRGHSHGRALRSIADRLLNVACAMLKTGTTFNPSLATEKTP
jgi:transposase